MEKVFAYIRKYGMIRENEKILAGVSGGADSMCLLCVLQSYRKIVPFSLAVAHVEHGIRGKESLEDARFVKRYCKEHGIACICVSLQVQKAAREQKLSLEEAARIQRYEVFEKIRSEKGFDRIAVAHNQNDQAETMLFSMARGCGLKGAGGIRPVRGHIIRPLLCVNRAEIEAYLQKRGIAWREDATNACTDYSRNLLRHNVLPLLQQVNTKAVAHLCALAQELQETRGFLEQRTRETLCRLAVFGCGSASLDINALLKEEKLMQELCLQKALELAGCGLKDITREHIGAIRALLSMQSGRSADLPGGWRALRQFDKLMIIKDASRGETEFSLEYTGPGTYETPFGTFACRVFQAENQNILQKTYTKWFDCDKINGRLFFRTAQPGDFLTVNRDGGTKKLNRYLMEQKVPPDERGAVLLLTVGSEVLWAVGHRIGERFKVTRETEKILEVQRMGESDGRKDQYFNTGRESGCEDQGNGGADQP